MSLGFGYEGRAPYASHPLSSRGRLFAIEESPTRTSFQRDRDRIIHSSAFRRLQYKTQVFMYHEGDHYRTRLTHTLEVAQISRSIARALRLDEDLAEALALAHDLGHPPFAHAGEQALQALMQDHSGFDHNAQSLRVVTKLEKRYAQHEGLNLSWEVLEGISKHNGPLVGKLACEKLDDLPYAIEAVNSQFDLRLDHFASLEAQVAAIADDIAYNAHDIDDGCRAGLISLDSLEGLDLIRNILDSLDTDHQGLSEEIRLQELIRRLITLMVEDVIMHSQSQLKDFKIKTLEDVAQADHKLVTFSKEMADFDKQLKTFMFEHVYWHESIIRVMKNAQSMIHDLFHLYLDKPDMMEEHWARDTNSKQGAERARAVTDYIAGMTDRFAIHEYQRLFDRHDMPDLIR